MNVAVPVEALSTGQSPKPPLLTFLEQSYARFRDDQSGAVANYIPELSKADPTKFGVAVATIDGHVYQVGDAAFPFTIQSVSKAFVFVRNLAKLLAHRLLQANAKIDLLSAN